MVGVSGLVRPLISLNIAVPMVLWASYSERWAIKNEMIGASRPVLWSTEPHGQLSLIGSRSSWLVNCHCWLIWSVAGSKCFLSHHCPTWSFAEMNFTEPTSSILFALNLSAINPFFCPQFPSSAVPFLPWDRVNYKKPFSFRCFKTCHLVLCDLELVLLGREASGSRVLFHVQTDSGIDRCHPMMTFKGGWAPMSEGFQSGVISVIPDEDYFCQLYLFLWEITL